jgi:hypothetical protein
MMQRKDRSAISDTGPVSGYLEVPVRGAPCFDMGRQKKLDLTIVSVDTSISSKSV